MPISNPSDAMPHGNALVVGQGSIGQRHARILRELQYNVVTVSANHPDSHRTVADAFRSAGDFDYVVVANETTKHVNTVSELYDVGYLGALLVEKPVAAQLNDLEPISGIWSKFSKFGVAYNLRFHPVISALRHALQGKTVRECRMRVGQYLPDWRPGTDYRQGASARMASGGGVLRDLSHEIDLQLHLFGPWRELVSAGGRLGVLDIETDEAWSIIARMNPGLLTLTLNYLDRKPERQIVVTTIEDTIVADLIVGTLSDSSGVQQFEVGRDDTYRLQHQAMLGTGSLCCTFDEATAVMQTIKAVEQSSAEKRWISN